MAWPKLRNHRSPGPSATAGHDAGAAPDGTPSHAVAPDRAERPTWRAREGWPASNPTVRPIPAEPGPIPAEPGPIPAEPGPIPAEPGPSLAEPGPSLAESGPSLAAVPEAETDPFDPPFWASWAPTDDAAGLDDPGDGLPEGEPADDAVTDVDPRPRGSWEAVVTPVTDPREPPRAEGIGQHLGSLAHLSEDPRMRVWRRRAVVAVIAGVAFGILLHSWVWGLTFAVLAAIADTIIRSRTSVVGPAGVKLTKAQKGTIRQLDGLQRRGYRAMHILPIPDSDEQIDHLVIGPAGVFAVDSEQWDKRMPVRTSSHLKLWHGPNPMTDRLEHAHWEADQAAKLLSAAMGRPVTVRAAMAVYGPRIPFDVAEIRDVDVFSGPQLRKYLRRRARRRGTQPLTESEIERLDKAAHEAFPQAPAS
jgi:Nuclease-related domain